MDLECRKNTRGINKNSMKKKTAKLLQSAHVKSVILAESYST